MSSPIRDPLTELMRQEIESAGGYISFARFMELALYAPTFGYYSAGSNIFGHEGDFITAPLISPLFTRCVSRQFKQILDELNGGDILEIGAGSGVFAKDALLELEALESLPQHYFIYEISTALRREQQQLLQTACPHLLSRVQWLEELPQEFCGIIFANEVLDALPVRLFQIDENDIKERSVGWDHNQFQWQLTLPEAEFANHVEQLRDEFALPPGYESEINIVLSSYISKLADTLKQGVILFFDYGYGRREYYHRDREHGTLMCFHEHRGHDNPLINVGLQDMTAHVDFTAVAEHAVQSGLSLAGFTTQAGFLLACGLLEMAEQQAASAVDQYQQSQAIKKLTLPAQMGELVKVIALSKELDLKLRGFELQDRRRDL
jgi:SAM-dependent MidA family methyltransferase